MEVFKSTKIIDGFSTCFRQWKAESTHCKYLHGYSIYFHITFESFTLDDRNWVMDFGFMKRSKHYMNYNDERGWTHSLHTLTPSKWFEYIFDHTTIISHDDPEKEIFYKLEKKGIIQLRIFPKVGCEIFAKFVYEELNRFVKEETEGRVRVSRVECFEHPKNSAIYEKFISNIS